MSENGFRALLVIADDSVFATARRVGSKFDEKVLHVVLGHPRLVLLLAPLLVKRLLEYKLAETSAHDEVAADVSQYFALVSKRPKIELNSTAMIDWSLSTYSRQLPLAV